MSETDVFVLADHALDHVVVEEAGQDKFDGDLLGNDPKAAFSAMLTGRNPR